MLAAWATLVRKREPQPRCATFHRETAMDDVVYCRCTHAAHGRVCAHGTDSHIRLDSDRDHIEAHHFPGG